MTDEQLAAAALGYTLASGRLFCPFSDFHAFVEAVAGRPIMTHELGNDDVWSELKERFEAAAALRVEQENAAA